MLLVPEQFPTDENPTAGIFMRDQVRALSRFCEPVVYNSSPWSRGTYLTDIEAEYYEMHVMKRKWPSPLHLLGYALWEARSYRFGKAIPKCDLIHLHGAALRGGWVSRLARHWKVPYVVTEHTGPWSAVADRPVVFRRAKRAMESAAAVLPVSRHLAEEIHRSGVRPSEMEVTGNPVDVDLFALRSTPLTQSKTILFVGRLDRFKGGLRTVRAFHAISDRIPGYRLRIIGRGPEEADIAQYIAESGLGSSVELIRHTLTRAAMVERFHGAAFLVFPSEFESFGLVAAEAMATGLPVVIANRTGPKDFSTNATTIPVNPESVEDIARGMAEMVERLEAFDPATIRRTIDEEFGLNAYAERLERLYDQVSRASTEETSR